MVAQQTRLQSPSERARFGLESRLVQSWDLHPNGHKKHQAVAQVALGPFSSSTWYKQGHLNIQL